MVIDFNSGVILNFGSGSITKNIAPKPFLKPNKKACNALYANLNLAYERVRDSSGILFCAKPCV